MSAKKKPSPIQVTLDMDTFFQEEVLAVAQKQGLKVSPFATQYLARVLAKFANADSYLPTVVKATGESQREVPKLALLWLNSITQNPTDQYFQLQFLGDFALFTSGFFGDRIKSSVVDLDYYVAMGGQAYQRAGQLRETIASENALNVFFELSTGFAEFVEVFAEISDQSLLANDQSLLKLYEKWLASRSDRIGRMLNEQGVIPSLGKKDEN